MLEANKISPIGIDSLDHLGVDQGGSLYWKGKQVRTVNRLKLNYWQNAIAVAVAIATIVQAVTAVLSLMKE